MTSAPNLDAIASRADAGRSTQSGRRAVARSGITRPSRVTTLSAIHSSRACMAPYCGTRWLHRKHLLCWGPRSSTAAT
jgi:hypothetical protein